MYYVFTDFHFSCPGIVNYLELCHINFFVHKSAVPFRLIDVCFVYMYWFRITQHY